MVVPDARVDKAMCFLAETDLEVAEWKGAVLRTEFMAKSAEALSVYKSLRVRWRIASKGRASMSNVKKVWRSTSWRWSEHETLKARREREVLVIDLWRSVNANRRAANVT